MVLALVVAAVTAVVVGTHGDSATTGDAARSDVTVTPATEGAATTGASPGGTATPGSTASSTGSPSSTASPTAATTARTPAGSPSAASQSGSTPRAAGSTSPAAGPRPQAVGAFPGDDSTGVPAGRTLRHVEGDLVITKNGTMVHGVDVTGGIVVKADDVTITGSRVRCQGVSDFCVAMVGRGGELIDSEIGGGADGRTVMRAIGVWSGGDDGTATSTRLARLDVHHVSDGLRVDGYTTVSDSWVHDLSYQDGAHSDGTTTSAGRLVVYRHNTLEGGTNCAIFLQQNGGEAIAGVVIQNNLLVPVSRAGQESSFGICLDDAVRDVTVTGNVFGRGGWQVGPATHGYGWATWSDNRYQDGTPLPRP